MKNIITKVEILYDGKNNIDEILAEGRKVLDNIQLNAGDFTFVGAKCMLKFIIRPIRADFAYGQPIAHQYATLYACGAEEDYEIARYHFE